MRKVIYTHMVSLDGYIEADKSYKGPNWAVSDEELTRRYARFLSKHLEDAVVDEE